MCKFSSTQKPTLPMGIIPINIIPIKIFLI